MMILKENIEMYLRKMNKWDVLRTLPKSNILKIEHNTNNFDSIAGHFTYNFLFRI